MFGGSLDVARAALDRATGQPCRLFWSPLTLAIVFQGQVTTLPFGPPLHRGPSPLPSWLWPTAVFSAVVSALAEALLQDLPNTDDAAGSDGATA